MTRYKLLLTGSESLEKNKEKISSQYLILIRLDLLTTVFLARCTRYNIM
jgi:hypothetical protein